MNEQKHLSSLDLSFSQILTMPKLHFKISVGF